MILFYVFPFFWKLYESFFAYFALVYQKLSLWFKMLHTLQQKKPPLLQKDICFVFISLHKLYVDISLTSGKITPLLRKIVAAYILLENTAEMVLHFKRTVEPQDCYIYTLFSLYTT